MHPIRVIAACVLLVVLPATAQQQPVVLTLEDALERARQTAPAVVAARMRIDEARGYALGVDLPFSTNPTVEVEAGRRSGQTSATDYAVEVAQDIDPPARRHARIDAAQAVVTQEGHRVREVENGALRDVATTFSRAVESRERSEAAASARRLATEALGIAERRYSAGDVAQLDVNLVRTAVARAEAELRMADATLTGHLTRLQVLLGMTEPVSVDGSLRDALTLATTDLIAGVTERPDVRVLDAEIAEAEAEQRIARTLRWPDLGVRASYSREEGDRSVTGGIGLTLPIFHRGQRATAIATARLARLRVQRDALTRAAEAEVQGAVTTHNALRAAASEFERAVLPLIEENERLALESYEVGQIGLADLLLVRREALDARRSLIDQLIETRLAEIELRARAGVWK